MVHPGRPDQRRDDRPEDFRTLFSLDGDVAIVTGGGRGIGLAIARGLGQAGARVVLADIDEVRAQEAAEGLRSQGLEASGVATDVTSTPQIAALCTDTERRYGSIDILVNNAGITARIPAENYPDEDLERMIALNVEGVFRGMREVARRWIATGREGRILNLASFAGLVADPMSAPYAASKGAVVQLTRTCAVEWARHGIRVNAIAPGYVRTEMTAHTLDDPAVGAEIRRRTPLGRPALPEEMAGAAVFLCSRASSYVTGHILAVDGGWTAV
ncbi:MAG: glucose 1-dehydrogenase [Candidatus Eisenbacteria bacterium]